MPLALTRMPGAHPLNDQNTGSSARALCFTGRGLHPLGPPRVVLSGSYVTPHSQNFLLNTINNVFFQHLEQFMTHTKLRLWPTDLLTPLPTS
jgi:hypothetical protein